MLIAEFSLSTPILRDALAAAPGTTVDLERASPGSPKRMSVLARGQDLNRFEDALAHDESVQSVAVRGRGPAFAQYELTLTPEADARATSPWWRETEAEPLSAEGDSQGWDLRMRFPSREALATYRDVCRGRDISFTLHDLYARERLATEDEYGLASERPGGADADQRSPGSDGPAGEGDLAPDRPNDGTLTDD